MAILLDKPVTIYISATDELMAEREELARMIARLPVDLPWHIVQTPLGSQPFDTTALRAADFFVLLMAGDIRAPVGWELQNAIRSGQRVTGFLKQSVLRTPAGLAFVRQATTQIEWQPFKDAADVSRQMQKVLVRSILQQATTFALRPDDILRLEQLLSDPSDSENIPETGSGTGHSAVLVSRERPVVNQDLNLDEE
jgi:hypothetical protein